MCRFQREWAEELLPELVGQVGGDAGGVWPHHFDLARRLTQRADVLPWDTQRTRDRISTYLTEASRDDPDNPEIRRWVEAFRDDSIRAAREYWHALRRGLLGYLEESRPSGELSP
jgi:hypothetical protein